MAKSYCNWFRIIKRRYPNKQKVSCIRSDFRKLLRKLIIITGYKPVSNTNTGTKPDSLFDKSIRNAGMLFPALFLCFLFEDYLLCKCFHLHTSSYSFFNSNPSISPSYCSASLFTVRSVLLLETEETVDIKSSNLSALNNRDN